MIRTILGFTLALSFAVPSWSAENDSVDLRYRSYRKWTMQLPNETWFPVNDAVKIGDSAGAVFAVELDGNELKFDTDADGKLDRTIKPLIDEKTKVSTTRVILSGKDSAGEAFRYAVRLRKDAAGWEWAPGGAMAGTLTTEAGPIPLRIIDQDGNGHFGDVGSDAMIVGTTEYATLLSKTIAIDDKLLSVEYGADGKSIQLTDYTGPTATIDLKSSFQSKAVLMSAVIMSSDRQHSFDVGMIDGSVTVPAGEYTIASGTLGLGQQRAQISAGRMKPLKLAPNATESLEWGGPIQSEFQFARSGDQVQFSPNNVWYYGKAGERYVGWTPIGKSPEFKVLNANTGAVMEVAILPGSC